MWFNTYGISSVPHDGRSAGERKESLENSGSVRSCGGAHSGKKRDDS